MTEELNCEGLKDEQLLIIEQLCNRTIEHALSAEDLYLILQIEKPLLGKALGCLLEQGIVCEDSSNVHAFKRYVICNRDEICGTVVDIQRIAGILEGRLR